VQAKVSPGLTLSAAAINGLRRDVLTRLTALRARRELPRLGRPARVPNMPGNRRHPVLTAQVTTREQITPTLLRTAPAVLYVPIHILAEDETFCRELTRRVTVCAVLPRIVHDGELPRLRQAMTDVRAMGVRQVLVGNLGLLVPAQECGMELRGDFGLNLFNSGAVNTARQMELLSATVSFEMTLVQIRDVSKAVPCEALCYGRLPLMVTENCLIRNRTGACTCTHASTKLVDKLGADFPIIKDGDKCRSVVLNGKKLNWLDRQKDLSKLGVWATRLYFTTENPREVDQVLSALANPPAFDPGSSTRGLYLRGLD
jgi:putative protease